MKDWKNNRIAPMTLLAAALLALAALAAACVPWRLARLIDVGVRSGGVEYATPLRIRASTMDDLRLFLPEDTAKEAKRAYDLVNGVYVLHGTGAAKRMSEAFALPVLEYLRTSEQGVNTFAAIRASIDHGTMTAEDVRAQALEAVEAMGELPPRARVEAAAAFVRTEYAVSGGNVNALRSGVITAELWHIAALTLAALSLGAVGLRLGAEEARVRIVFPTVLAICSAICAIGAHTTAGLLLIAEAAALIFALIRCRPRERRAIALAAGILVCAALPCLVAGDVLALKLSPGRLIALLAWALLAAVPALSAKNGKEARA